MINPASRLNSIELSLIRKMFEVTNPNAINLGIGEPDFNVFESKPFLFEADVQASPELTVASASLITLV